MKYISDEYPFLGYNFSDDESFKEIYKLSSKIIELIIADDRSYSEARKIMEYVDTGLKTLKFPK